MFFLMRDWLRDMVEPCLLAREIDVAREIEAASWFISMVCVHKRIEGGPREYSRVTQGKRNQVRTQVLSAL